MKKKNILKGKIGETIAVKHLEALGFKIVEKNWRFSRVGEIDIIAEDKSEDKNILVFIEVKTRSSNLFGTPLESVNEKKFGTMQKLAEIYLSKIAEQGTENNYDGCRFDLIGILLKEKPEITYCRDIY